MTLCSISTSASLTSSPWAQLWARQHMTWEKRRITVLPNVATSNYNEIIFVKIKHVMQSYLFLSPHSYCYFQEFCSLICWFTESGNFASHEWHDEPTISCHEEIKSRGAPWKQSLQNPLNVFEPLSNHPHSAREPNGQRCRCAHRR